MQKIFIKISISDQVAPWYCKVPGAFCCNLWRSLPINRTFLVVSEYSFIKLHQSCEALVEEEMHLPCNKNESLGICVNSHSTMNKIQNFNSITMCLNPGQGKHFTVCYFVIFQKQSESFCELVGRCRFKRRWLKCVLCTTTYMLKYCEKTFRI